MNWIGSGLVALAGVLAVELVLGWAQRMRLARTGGPIPELLEELRMGDEELVESLLAEGRLSPEDLDLVTGRQSWEPPAKTVLRGLLREIDRALWIRLGLAAIVWSLAATFMVTAHFSWGRTLILVIPAVFVAGLVLSVVSRTGPGGGPQPE